jgi:uncharacterized protein (AIM24 family)
MSQLRTNGRRVLEAHLQNSSIRAISGSMVAYDGQVQFKSAGMGGGEGVVAGLKRKATGESLSLMECAGSGVVYLAVDAQDVMLVELIDETLQVESRQLLALAGQLRMNVKFAGVRGAATGQGLFTTAVSGTGQVAILSAGGPLIGLEVSSQYPLVVDPDAFVAARGQLSQSFVTDISWASAVGEGSGEPYSLRWEGQGVVYIQPAERP